MVHNDHTIFLGSWFITRWGKALRWTPPTLFYWRLVLLSSMYDVYTVSGSGLGVGRSTLSSPGRVRPLVLRAAVCMPGIPGGSGVPIRRIRGLPITLFNIPNILIF